MLPEGEVPEYYRVWQREDGSPWRLGDGAYKASDLRTDELVVLRFFEAPVEGAGDQAALARLAQKLSGIHSPNVVALRDLFIRARTHLAVVEFVEGLSLADRVREHGAGTSETVLALAQVALEALTMLHKAGVAHGSLGPSKLLFSLEDGLLKLSDGGLHRGAAAVVPPTGNTATADDLRRLGITLWFALAGTLPFTEGLDAPEEAVPKWEQLHALPTSASLRMLVALFARTLHRGERVQRPQTAAALVAALGTRGGDLRLVDELIPSEPMLPHVSIATAVATGLKPSTAGFIPTAKTHRTGRRVAGSMALLTLAAGLAATWFSQPLPTESRGLVEPMAASATHATGVVETPAVNEGNFTVNDPAFPPLSGGPPVSAVGIQARAAGIQNLQPDTLEALKPARELRRVATLPVPDGRKFPDEATVRRVMAALTHINPPTPTHRTALILILGYSDETDTEEAVKGSQEEADAFAGALFHGGIVAPVYACGLGDSSGMPEVDAEVAGGGGFVEVWVAFLLF